MQTTIPYIALELHDRLVSELSSERSLAGDLRAQMDGPHYTLSEDDRQCVWNLYDVVIKKIEAIERLMNTAKGTDSEKSESSCISIPELCREYIPEEGDPQTMKKSKDFLYYEGSLYGRLAMTFVPPDFMSTATAVESVKKNPMDDCLRACQRRNLQKFTTIHNTIKYEIAKEIGMQDVGEFADFEHGQYAYQTINKLMADNGYCRKKNRENR
jgi:hypothetical protein